MWMKGFSMKKCISYWAFPGGGDGSKNIAESMAEAEAAGFEGIELALGESGELNLQSDEAQVRSLVRDAEKAGIEIAGICTGLFWKYSLTSDDAQVRAKALRVIEKGLQVASWAGTDALLVVPGTVASPISSERVRYDVAWERSMAAIREAAPLAQELGVDIAIENVWNGFLLSPMEMSRFVDEIGNSRVGVYFDVGNVLGVHGEPQDWIRILGKRIRRIHLKDFKRSVANINGFVDLLAGDVNWPEVIAALHEIGYEGPLTAEMFPYAHHPAALIHTTSIAMDYIMGRR